MMEDVRVLSLEIEQLARERDDFLDITALPGQNGWEALVRKMDVEKQLRMDALLIERDPSAMRFLQGFIAGLTTVKSTVESASEAAKIRQEDVSTKTREKDDLLVQEEYEPRESLSPQF